MAEIHIHSPGKEPVIHSEERVAELLKSGELPSETLYWREGMTDWQPISSFQPAPAGRHSGPLPDPLSHPEDESAPTGPRAKDTEFTTVPATGRRRFSFRRNPEPLTTIVQVLLMICLCVALLELGNGFVRYSSISHPPLVVLDQNMLPSPNAAAPGSLDAMAPPAPNAPPPPASASDQEDDIGNFLEYMGWGTNALLAVTYFMWLYRTNQNCRNFSFILRFKSEWAVACYFVPVVNFFRPCHVMQDIWRVSNNPRTWHNDRYSILVGVWWGLTLATAVLCGYSFLHSALATAAFSGISFLYSMEPQTRNEQAQAELIFLALKVLQIAWYGVFLGLVTQIVHNQVRSVRKSKRRSEFEDAA